jgi:hypothetical protein
MELAQLKLHQIAEQLPPQQLEEVIDFAEFLTAKKKNGSRQNIQSRPRLKRFELPAIEDVKFIGDPLLRREDMYNEWGR